MKNNIIVKLHKISDKDKTVKEDRQEKRHVMSKETKKKIKATDSFLKQCIENTVR